jgi:hypothetical protein
MADSAAASANGRTAGRLHADGDTTPCSASPESFIRFHETTPPRYFFKGCGPDLPWRTFEDKEGVHLYHVGQKLGDMVHNEFPN